MFNLLFCNDYVTYLYLPHPILMMLLTYIDTPNDKTFVALICRHLVLFSWFLLGFCHANILFAQTPFAHWNKEELVLNNGYVQRTIHLPKGSSSFGTTHYKPVKGDFNYFENTNPEFSFELNHQGYSGLDLWTLVDIQIAKDTRQGNGAMVKLLSADKLVEVSLQYLLYPHLPIIRKNISIKNLSDNTITLESVDVEKLSVTHYYATTYSWICHDYGRRRSIGPYDGNMQDALLTIHNSDWQQGIVVGNEASGILKHTSAFWEERAICSGLTHKDGRYPFRKYLKSGESFVSPQVFTVVYNNQKDPDEILNTIVPTFVTKHLGIRLSELAQKPTFVYNTWEPFNKAIDEKLVKELAKSAADAGMKEFIIDDGWSDNYGDWTIDKTKFPNGLKPLFDYIKSLGMKPGLWVSVGSASTESRVYKEHPEWFVLDEKQQPYNLHWDDSTMVTACFSTGWKDYIKKVLMKMALDYGLEYMKLDFTVVTSPYKFGHKNAGCFAKNHPSHHDREESYYVNYEAVWELFDDLHQAKPDLFIDCTFETMGGLQMIDYAMLKHAEGNWLSNFAGPPQENVDLRVRNMAWWRSPAMPATALVIGNPAMQDEAWEMHIKSLAGALPIMLGDPRKLPAKDFKTYRAYADWLQKMENTYQFMSYRQDLEGFDEPKEGLWDGFQRINTTTRAGGIIGVFRHGSQETERRVFVKYLKPEKYYKIKEGISGKVIGLMTGTNLAQVGFTIKLLQKYDGRLLEIAEVSNK